MKSLKVNFKDFAENLTMVTTQFVEIFILFLNCKNVTKSLFYRLFIAFNFYFRGSTIVPSVGWAEEEYNRYSY